MIEFKNVYSGYGNHIVHENISFKIEKSEIVAIVGGSGSGKSTLVKLMLFLLKPKSGEIYFDGEKIDFNDEKTIQKIRDKIGVVFQFNALFNSITSVENVMYPVLKKTSLSKDIAFKNAIVKLNMVGFTNIWAYPGELSGGMKKKVALARALALEPDILILDEPTSGLDPISADEFDSLIKSTRDSLGTTVVIVTHDIASLKIVDRVLILYDKKIIFNGSPSLLKVQNHPWIQSFIKGQRGHCYD